MSGNIEAGIYASQAHRRINNLLAIFLAAAAFSEAYRPMALLIPYFPVTLKAQGAAFESLNRHVITVTMSPSLSELLLEPLFVAEINVEK